MLMKERRHQNATNNLSVEFSGVENLGTDREVVAVGTSNPLIYCVLIISVNDSDL